MVLLPKLDGEVNTLPTIRVKWCHADQIDFDFSSQRVRTLDYLTDSVDTFVWHNNCSHNIVSGHVNKKHATLCVLFLRIIHNMSVKQIYLCIKVD